MRSFEQAVVLRRTNYALGKDSGISAETILKSLETVITAVPSAFNMQSARVVLALGDKHQEIWDITKAALQKIVPEQNFPDTEAKINGFAAAQGTLLFFEELGTVEHMQQTYAAYAENFPIWAQQANGMLQFAVWTALSELGLGANLQHYNPLIDESVKKRFEVPATWKLVAQMPFGEILARPEAKEKLPISERLRVCR